MSIRKRDSVLASLIALFLISPGALAKKPPKQRHSDWPIGENFTDRTFCFHHGSLAPSHELNASEIAAALRTAMMNASGIKALRVTDRSSQGNSSYTVMRGMSAQLDEREQYVVVTYTNGKHALFRHKQVDASGAFKGYRESRSEHDSVDLARFPYTLTVGDSCDAPPPYADPPASNPEATGKDRYHVLTVTAPQAVTRTETKFSIAWMKPLLPPERVNVDLARIHRKMVPKVEKHYEVTGEVDVSFHVDAVFANFSRLMTPRGNPRTVNDSRHGVFRTDDGLDIAIKVLPYRDGAKVEYRLSGDYVVLADGTSTYSQSKVDGAVTDIIAVAND